MAKKAVKRTSFASPSSPPDHDMGVDVDENDPIPESERVTDVDNDSDDLDLNVEPDLTDEQVAENEAKAEVAEIEASLAEAKARLAEASANVVAEAEAPLEGDDRSLFIAVDTGGGSFALVPMPDDLVEPGQPCKLRTILYGGVSMEHVAEYRGVWAYRHLDRHV